VGKLKEGVGRATGDDQLAGEGLVDQIAGAVKDTAGQAPQALGATWCLMSTFRAPPNASAPLLQLGMALGRLTR
jgi:hypothetical protein